jgi:hypothetical protein
VTHIQLDPAIRIRAFAILIRILTNVVHHNSTNARFNSVETRIGNLDVKFDTLIGKVINVDNRVTRIEAKRGIG